MNWIAPTVQSIDRASALASIVLPTPGTSSMSRWPSASSTAIDVLTVSPSPSMTDSMFAAIWRAVARTSSRGAVPAAAGRVSVVIAPSSLRDAPGETRSVQWAAITAGSPECV